MKQKVILKLQNVFTSQLVCLKKSNATYKKTKRSLLKRNYSEPIDSGSYAEIHINKIEEIKEIETVTSSFPTINSFLTREVEIVPGQYLVSDEIPDSKFLEFFNSSFKKGKLIVNQKISLRKGAKVNLRVLMLLKIVAEKTILRKITPVYLEKDKKLVNVENIKDIIGKSPINNMEKISTKMINTNSREANLLLCYYYLTKNNPQLPLQEKSINHLLITEDLKKLSSDLLVLTKEEINHLMEEYKEEVKVEKVEEIKEQVKEEVVEEDLDFF